MSVKDGLLLIDGEKRASAKTVVTQVLGRIAVEDAHALVEGEPASNNTRWIVDVETFAGSDVELQLLEHRSGRHIEPDLMSFSITPLDADCCDAKPFAVPGRGRLTVRTRALNTPRVLIRYRVAIDVMHSATR